LFESLDYFLAFRQTCRSVVEGWKGARRLAEAAPRRPSVAPVVAILAAFLFLVVDIVDIADSWFFYVDTLRSFLPSLTFTLASIFFAIVIRENMNMNVVQTEEDETAVGPGNTTAEVTDGEDDESVVLRPVFGGIVEEFFGAGYHSFRRSLSKIRICYHGNRRAYIIGGEGRSGIPAVSQLLKEYPLRKKKQIQQFAAFETRKGVPPSHPRSFRVSGAYSFEGYHPP